MNDSINQLGGHCDGFVMDGVYDDSNGVVSASVAVDLVIIIAYAYFKVTVVVSRWVAAQSLNEPILQLYKFIS